MALKTKWAAEIIRPNELDPPRCWQVEQLVEHGSKWGQYYLDLADRALYPPTESEGTVKPPTPEPFTSPTQPTLKRKQ